MLKKRLTLDMVERAVRTILQFIIAYRTGQWAGITPEASAAIAGGLSIGMSALGTRVGDKGTAALLPSPPSGS